MVKIKSIDKKSLIPRYAQLKENLRKMILKKYRVEDKIPSERQLAQMCQVARATVVRAIKELEQEGLLYSDHGRGTFVVNSSNRAAISGRSLDLKSIDVVVPLSANFEDIIMDVFVLKSEYTGIKNACKDQGLDIHLHDMKEPRKGVYFSKDLRGFATIFVSNWYRTPEKLIPKLRSRGMLWITIGGGLEQKFPTNCIFADLEGGARLALEHLIKLGHKRIGYCFTAEDVFDPRKKLFNEFLSKEGLSSEYLFPINLRCETSAAQVKEYAYAAIRERFQTGKKICTAFFCQNDFIALGVLKAVREAGLKVPDDVAIIGFDDRPESKESIPRLTTVRVPFEEMGYEALCRVKGHFEKGIRSFPTIKLPCSLIVRDSC